MSTVISSGQTLDATAGETSDYTIASGGTLVYDVGATLSDITLQSGANFVEVGLELDAGSTMTVAPVTADVVLDVPSTGTITNVTSVSATTVNAGAILTVASGGFATATTVSAGGSETVNGQESGGSVAAGGVVIVGADGVVLSETVSAGGVLSAVDGGILGESPDSDGSLVLAGGTLVIAGGGTYGDSTIYGTEIVSGGASLWNYYDKIESGGRQDIYAGGSGSASITNGGVVEVFNGGYGSEEVFGGGVAIADSGGTVRGLDTAGAEFDIRSGGELGASYISAGSLLKLETATSGVNTDILTGSKVVEEGVTLTAGQTLTVAPNTSSLYGVTWSGALLSGVTSASGAVVDSTAHLSVMNGGVATSSTVQAGGSETVAGVESGATLSGGELDIANGGALEGVDFAGAGRLVIEAGGAVDGLISGFGATGAFIDFTGAGDHLVWSQGAGSGSLEFENSVGGDSETLELAGTYDQSNFTLTQNGGVEEVAYCFARGSRILTPRGEVAVEDLRPGEAVVTADGTERPILWIGVKTVGGPSTNPLGLAPIRIRKGALGEERPVRDLLLSPAHALLVDGLLIQARALVNGVSIVRQTFVPDGFEYYHIGLSEHALLTADGALAESFLDAVDPTDFDIVKGGDIHGANPAPMPELPIPRVTARRQIPLATLKRLDAIRSVWARLGAAA